MGAWLLCPLAHTAFCFQVCVLPEAERSLQSYTELLAIKGTSFECALGAVAVNGMQQLHRAYSAVGQALDSGAASSDPSESGNGAWQGPLEALKRLTQWSVLLILVLVVVYGIPTDTDVLLTNGVEHSVVLWAVRYLAIVLAICCVLLVLPWLVQWVRPTKHNLTRHSADAHSDLSLNSQNNESLHREWEELGVSKSLRTGTIRDDGTQPAAAVGEGVVGGLCCALNVDSSAAEHPSSHEQPSSPTGSAAGQACMPVEADGMISYASAPRTADATDQSRASVSHVEGDGRIMAVKRRDLLGVIAFSGSPMQLEWQGCTDERVMALHKAIRSVQRDAVIEEMEESFCLATDGKATRQITAERTHQRLSTQAPKQEYSWLGTCALQVLPSHHHHGRLSSNRSCICLYAGQALHLRRIHTSTDYQSSSRIAGTFILLCAAGAP